MGLNLESAPHKTMFWSHWQRLYWEPLPEREEKCEPEVSWSIPCGKDLVKKNRVD